MELPNIPRVCFRRVTLATISNLLSDPVCTEQLKSPTQEKKVQSGKVPTFTLSVHQQPPDQEQPADQIIHTSGVNPGKQAD
jgi:hypothetical protein